MGVCFGLLCRYCLRPWLFPPYEISWLGACPHLIIIPPDAPVNSFFGKKTGGPAAPAAFRRKVNCRKAVREAALGHWKTRDYTLC